LLVAGTPRFRGEDAGTFGSYLGGIGVSTGETSCEQRAGKRRGDDQYRADQVFQKRLVSEGVYIELLGEDELDREAENSTDYAAELDHLGESKSLRTRPQAGRLVPLRAPTSVSRPS
jgi:hypothetical protein